MKRKWNNNKKKKQLGRKIHCQEIRENNGIFLFQFNEQAIIKCGIILYMLCILSCVCYADDDRNTQESDIKYVITKRKICSRHLNACYRVDKMTVAADESNSRT